MTPKASANASCCSSLVRNSMRSIVASLVSEPTGMPQQLLKA